MTCFVSTSKRQLHSLKQPAQLPIAELEHLLFALRPVKVLPRKTLLPETEPRAIPVEYLYLFVPLIAETEQVAAVGIPRKLLLGYHRQSIDLFADTSQRFPRWTSAFRIASQNIFILSNVK